jgi:hypothetical protein
MKLDACAAAEPAEFVPAADKFAAGAAVAVALPGCAQAEPPSRARPTSNEQNENDLRMMNSFRGTVGGQSSVVSFC